MRSYSSNRENSMFVFNDRTFVMPLKELLTLRYKCLLTASPRL